MDYALQRYKYIKQFSMHSSRSEKITISQLFVTLFLATYFGHKIANLPDVKVYFISNYSYIVALSDLTYKWKQYLRQAY